MARMFGLPARDFYYALVDAIFLASPALRDFGLFARLDAPTPGIAIGTLKISNATQVYILVPFSHSFDGLTLHPPAFLLHLHPLIPLHPR